MKKFIAKFMAVFAAMAFVMPLSACGDEPSNGTLSVYAPDGAPALALSGVMSRGLSGFGFTVVNAETIAATVANKTADIAIMPINQAAQLYIGGRDIVMLAVATHGNLFVIGGGDNISLQDLKGKRLGTIGKGGVPDFTLRILLENASVGYEYSESAASGKVSLSYAAAPTLIAKLQRGDLDYALLPEPAVSAALDRLSESGIKIVADVQELWLDAFETEYPQACIVAQGGIIDKRKEDIDRLLAELKATEGFAAQNPEQAIAAVSAHMASGTQTTLSALAAQTVSRCNISIVSAEQSMDSCEAYFSRLITLRNELDLPVLARMPELEFYYQQ